MAKALIRLGRPDADSGFEAASIAAEDWLNIVAAVVHLANHDNPNVDAAYKLLMPGKEKGKCNLLESYREHHENLDQMKDKLRGVSDGPEKFKPLGPREYPLV